jgi:hypothetical protein
MTRTYEDAVGSVWPDSVYAACPPALAIGSGPMSDAAAAPIRVRGALKFSCFRARIAPRRPPPRTRTRPRIGARRVRRRLITGPSEGRAADRRRLSPPGSAADSPPGRPGAAPAPRHPATASAPAVLEKRLGISQTTRKSPDGSDHDPVRGPMRPGAPSGRTRRSRSGPLRAGSRPARRRAVADGRRRRVEWVGRSTRSGSDGPDPARMGPIRTGWARSGSDGPGWARMGRPVGQGVGACLPAPWRLLPNASEGLARPASRRRLAAFASQRRGPRRLRRARRSVRAAACAPQRARCVRLLALAPALLPA